MSDRLLTTDQAADYLGLSSQQLRHWRTRQVGPPYHTLPPADPHATIPRDIIRYQLSDLMRWLKKNRIVPQRPAPLPRGLGRPPIITPPPRLTNTQWALVHPILQRDGRGCVPETPAEWRRILDAIFFLAATDADPADLPPDIRVNLWKIQIQSSRWIADGRLQAALDALAGSDPDFRFALVTRYTVTPARLPGQRWHCEWIAWSTRIAGRRMGVRSHKIPSRTHKTSGVLRPLMIRRALAKATAPSQPP